MPSSTPAAPLDAEEDLQSDPLHGQRKRQRLKSRPPAGGEGALDDDPMSPEEEASASPPAAMIAGHADQERRAATPANAAAAAAAAAQFLAARERERACLRGVDASTPSAAAPPPAPSPADVVTLVAAPTDGTASLHSSDDERDGSLEAGASAMDEGGASDNPKPSSGGDALFESSASFVLDADDSCGTSDVEKFDGKIVYNPDGSAYIIEDSELSEEDASSLDLPHIIGDGCIVDGRGVSLPPQVQAFPQIANAFYVSRNASLYSTLYGGTAAYANSILQDKKIVPEVPIMHSYRVYTVRDKSGDNEDGKSELKAEGAGSRGGGDRGESGIPTAEETKKNEKYGGKDCSSVPVKPILMCFICKLSFGFAKSFVAHAMGDHNVVLLDDERDILGHKNASAIIQCVGKDKEPLVSFLEPLNPLSTNELSGKREARGGSGDVARPNPSSFGVPGDTKDPASATSSAGHLIPKDPKLLLGSGLGDLGAREEAGASSVGVSPMGEDAVALDCSDLRDATDPVVRGHMEAESLVVRHQSLDLASSVDQSNVHNQHVPETPVSLPQNGSSSNNVHNNNNPNLSNVRVLNSSMCNVMDLTRKSPISAVAATGTSGRSSASPGASPSPGSTLSPLLSAGAAAAAGAALPYPAPPPNFLTGTTIGVCPDHMGGRPSGVECAKCELILNSSRLGGVGGPLAGMHSRNSCKTLKCPKCNWHYKYQETLEIHMKEKHPETETSCIYCIAGQPHPRLARGETYTCGYKPYRCEVCNYSTTTKGNLSIHMQSDKHLNNMQELQNGGVPNSESAISGPGLNHPGHSAQAAGSHHGKGAGLLSPGGGPGHHGHHSHALAGAQNQKPKPTFRCDVCNYETNVARNLRIHMTSEKHTHNMMVLQQNVKHMQTLSALQHHHQQAQQHHPQALSFESLLHFHPGLTLPGDKPPPHTEAALADMAYNQALLIQMMTGGQLPPHVPPELAPHMDMGLNPETMEPPPEPADPNPKHLFQCCVCNVFSTDSLESLSHHLSTDRTKIREQEILAVVSGHYVCKLCTYKTNLKANFQLHCKTDKHLQRLQHVNHVKEGGQRNEWKLKYLSSPGGIQVRCHACDYYTNSAHKLQLHAAGPRHEASVMLFGHLRDSETAATQRALAQAQGDQTNAHEVRVYHCALCGFSARNKLALLQHVRSMKHLQMEQFHQLQRRSEGKDLHTDIGDVFQVIVQLEAGTGLPSFADAECDRKEPQQLSVPLHQQQLKATTTGRDSVKDPTGREGEGAPGDDGNADDQPAPPATPSHASPRGREESGAGGSTACSPSANQHMCPYCNYSSTSEMRVQAHVVAQHSGSEPSPPAASPGREFLCPLCQDNFRERAQLERHVMQIHSVNSEGLQRLLLLVDQSHWLNSVRRSAPSTPQPAATTTTASPVLQHQQQAARAPQQQQTHAFQSPPPQQTPFAQMVSPASACSSGASSAGAKEADAGVKGDAGSGGDERTDADRPDFSPSPDDQVDDENRCQACFKTFKNLDDLCAHQNESGHLELKQTPNGPGYLCWKKGCNQYFQSAHSLQMHFREIHSRTGGAPSVLGQNIAVSEKHVYKYRCNQCSLAFKTMEKLQLHSQYHIIRDATKCVICGRSFRSVLALHKHVETSHTELSEEELAAYKQSLLSNPLLLAGLSGQVLDPATNELLRKETLKIDVDETAELDDSAGKETPGLEDTMSASAADGDNSDDSLMYKEQQFLEDYLNSQAIAEDSYNDPNRKYKCHRCKVAFTRQSYLSSHNKTLLHRKGEKLSYPMEKYLDPNRPYKCDVCKESFTQKNILLVHYNSVSHLHKLKRAMQEQQQNNNNNNSSTGPSSHAASSAAAALASTLGVTPPSTPKMAVIEEDDKKPYKCNICKVAYSQGSTLDIHMRSVLHQTRASKLQDLALTGQIDLSKPLIEQPEPHKHQEQHKKVLHDILGSAQKQSAISASVAVSGSCNTIITSTSCQLPIANQGSSPVAANLAISQSSTATSPAVTPVPISISNSSTTSTSSTLTTHYSGNTIQTPQSPQQQHSQQHGMLSCQRCSALFVNQEQLNTHQQLYCLFSSPVPMFTPIASSGQTAGTGLTSQQLASKTPPPIQEDHMTRLSLPNKKSSQVYKHLLESFGFDLVMQFNENHQRRQRREREEEEVTQSLPTMTMQITDEPEEVAMKFDEENPSEQDLPEVSKSVCQHCKKEFSSVWVLKAHCEEVHRDLVPPEFLEKYAQQFKSEYEKKSVVITSSAASTSPSVVVSITSHHTSATPAASASTLTAPTPDASEKEEDNKELVQSKIAQQMQQQQQQQHQSQQQSVQADLPSTTSSTPTASSTPASSTESIPATLTASMAAVVGSLGGGPSGGPNAAASANLSMNLAQQMNEMQAALNVMAASQLQQQLQQFNPMVMSMAGLGMGLPLGLNMNALAAMNLQPPLVPMMMPPPPFDPLGLAQAQNPLFSPQAAAAAASMDPLLAKQQHMLQQQQAVSAAQQKRARTRITDEQLKILRGHFDINNSPSEDQIHEMASQSGLPPKVIKHWFRNTLFKERQRNKDSPYNFNNPPSTTLNLEEYEKTGEAKVMPLNPTPDEQTTPKDVTPVSTPSDVAGTSLANKRKHSTSQPFPQPPEIKMEPSDAILDNQDQKYSNAFSESELMRKDVELVDQKPPPHTLHPPPSPVTSVGGSTSSNNDQNVRTSSPGTLTLTSIISSQLGSNSMTATNPIMNTAATSPSNSILPSKLTPTSFAPPNQVSNQAHSLPLAPSSRSVSPGRSCNSNSSDGFSHGPVSASCAGNAGNNSSGSSSGKRANRTRFTDYQIKVLQEFFENNAYPKDDDLEYLSKLLTLSPRVIVVWFQNARQKARKVYENQPPVDASPGVDEGGANRFQRTPGLNYQCKKCLLVFQRYYELIRHQKTHCFKEEDAKRSAQAQAAAAQIAAVLSSEDSNSSTIVESNQQQQAVGTGGVLTASGGPQVSAPQMTAGTSPGALLATAPTSTPLAASPSAVQSSGPGAPRVLFPPSPAPTAPPNAPPTPARTQDDTKEGTFQCDKCNLVFPRFDLWREHQLVHIMNPNLFPTYPPDSPFGILQQHAQIQQQQMTALGVAELQASAANASPLAHPLSAILPTNKRKFDDYEDGNDRDSDHPKDKRLRTTILPEQLDYLYQKYQLESNPSRKMLENIAKEVGLKKRVVQVWFQNTRARERKGQFRAHAQVINKRCPFCPALFKVKSALESHLVTKHADQCTRGEINIDALPDEDASLEASPSFNSPHMSDSSKGQSNFNPSPQTPNMMPPLFPPFQSEIENSIIKKYYEESMKRYINELQAHHAAQNGGVSAKDVLHVPTDLSMKIKQEVATGSDVSSNVGDAPLDLSKPVDLSRPMKLSVESEARAESGPLTDLSEKSMGCEDDSTSETTDNMDGDESNPTSPASSTQSGQQRPLPPAGVKRFRTQMSSLQVKVMKSLFSDYKTPTMAECEMLGREIGLPKRVVQVWFQNARAKEKKNKLALQKALGGPDVPVSLPESRPPEECKLCQFKYSHKYSIQDHIFTKLHIDCVKAHIESGKSDMSGNTSDGGGSGSGEFTVPPVPGSSLGDGASAGGGVGATQVQPPTQSTPSQTMQTQPSQQQLAQLQMLQMAAASGLALPNSLSAQTIAVAAASVSASGTGAGSKDALGSAAGGTTAGGGGGSTAGGGGGSGGNCGGGGNGSAGPGASTGPSKSPAPGGVPGSEDMALLHQLYGLGLAGFSGGVQGNMFLHPAMFSAAAGGGGFFDPLAGLHGVPGVGGGCGVPLALLQLSPGALQAVAEAAALCEPGVTTVRVSSLEETSPPPPLPPALCREADAEVAFVCKKCRLAFPGESALLAHQRVSCYPGKSADQRGAIRLVEAKLECVACGERCTSVALFRTHCESEAHAARVGANGALLPPPPPKNASPGGGGASRAAVSAAAAPPSAVSPSEGLSHEMEDVVNQITLLAARAAAENCAPLAAAQPQPPTDSNANIKDGVVRDFCQGSDAAKRKRVQPPASTCSAAPGLGQ